MSEHKQTSSRSRLQDRFVKTRENVVLHFENEQSIYLFLLPSICEYLLEDNSSTIITFKAITFFNDTCTFHNHSRLQR